MSVLDTILNLTNYVTGEDITLHPGRCLNARHRGAHCTRCADVCPAEKAITITDGRPALNNDECLRCGACLQRCPTGAYTRPDAFSGKLEKTVAAMPPDPLDLLCPIHPNPTEGPAPYGVQTKRCLAALSAATLLELASGGADIWLDDTFCSACLLGPAHTAIEQAVTEANGWISLLDGATPVRLRSRQAEPPPAVARPVVDADKPPILRRRLFDSFRRAGREIEADRSERDVIKIGRNVPVSKRLPVSVPPQRDRVLSLLQNRPAAPASSAEPATLAVAEIHVDPAKCSACGLCAK
ncbi:MAG: 4Fe-4S dicluster domain-containing protein, partial [Chloroflexi bacterium]